MPTIVRIWLGTGTHPVWGIASGRERARIVTSSVLREKTGFTGFAGLGRRKLARTCHMTHLQLLMQQQKRRLQGSRKKSTCPRKIGLTMTRRRQALPMMTVRVMTMRTHGLAAFAERPIPVLLKSFGFSVRVVRLGTTLPKNVWDLMNVLQTRWTSGAAGLAILPWTDWGCSLAVTL